jgi:hypothetical protein
MTLHINDQRDHDDGVTASNSFAPNLIGWGETPLEALMDLNEYYSDIIQAVGEGQHFLDTWSNDQNDA